MLIRTTLDIYHLFPTSYGKLVKPAICLINTFLLPSCLSEKQLIITMYAYYKITCDIHYIASYGVCQSEISYYGCKIFSAP